jgi:hypothetical protein
MASSGCDILLLPPFRSSCLYGCVYQLDGFIVLKLELITLYSALSCFVRAIISQLTVSILWSLHEQVSSLLPFHDFALTSAQSYEELCRSWPRQQNETFHHKAAIGFEPILSATTATYAPDAPGFAVSRSGKHHAILNEYVDGDMHATRRVEIRSDLRLVPSESLIVSNALVHSSPTDILFLLHLPLSLVDIAKWSSSQFSPSETAIIFSAEANPGIIVSRYTTPYISPGPLA